jgi:hypothetical protein
MYNNLNISIHIKKLFRLNDHTQAAANHSSKNHKNRSHINKHY